MKELWTSLATLMGVFAFCQSLLHTVFPPEIRIVFIKLFNRIFHVFSSHCYFDIMEIDGVNTNELYNSVQLYLSNSASITGSRVSLSRAVNSSAFTFGLSNNDSLTDIFNGVTVWWEHIVTQRQSQTFSWRPLPEEKRGFILKIHKKDKVVILDTYLDYIMERASDIRRKNQDRLLYTNSRGGGLDSRGHPWESVPFKHPSTFETLAMDPVKKEEIMEDLKDFADGQGFYQKTGRAWKRGYLLYGPPGTGKSSMIAAMANHLGYDIYDMELTEVHTNSELRKLLMKTTNKSIIVIEDIDCSINLSNRNKKPNKVDGFPKAQDFNVADENPNSITLSGLLNFTDGLWSCCGSERIFVFTTNHIEKLDPALLRCGRMDMHVFMSYCSFPALKILIKNYLGLEEHGLFKELEEVTEDAQMTPADISEVLIKNRKSSEKAMMELVGVLKNRAALRQTDNLREKNPAEDEEEEQEKRALETPKKSEDSPENCESGEKDGEQQKSKD